MKPIQIEAQPPRRRAPPCQAELARRRAQARALAMARRLAPSAQVRIGRAHADAATRAARREGATLRDWIEARIDAATQAADWAGRDTPTATRTPDPETTLKGPVSAPPEQLPRRSTE